MPDLRIQITDYERPGRPGAVAYASAETRLGWWWMYNNMAMNLDLEPRVTIFAEEAQDYAQEARNDGLAVEVY